jgi:hypothetical protein
VKEKALDFIAKLIDYAWIKCTGASFFGGQGISLEEVMTEREMFEKSFQRPKDYFKLSARQQWDIDSRLGILDWDGDGLTEEDLKRFDAHYEK